MAIVQNVSRQPHSDECICIKIDVGEGLRRIPIIWVVGGRAHTAERCSIDWHRRARLYVVAMTTSFTQVQVQSGRKSAVVVASFVWRRWWWRQPLHSYEGSSSDVMCNLWLMAHFRRFYQHTANSWEPYHTAGPPDRFMQNFHHCSGLFSGGKHYSIAGCKMCGLILCSIFVDIDFSWLSLRAIHYK